MSVRSLKIPHNLFRIPDVDKVHKRAATRNSSKLEENVHDDEPGHLRILEHSSVAAAPVFDRIPAHDRPGTYCCIHIIKIYHRLCQKYPRVHDEDEAIACSDREVGTIYITYCYSRFDHRFPGEEKIRAARLEHSVRLQPC